MDYIPILINPFMCSNTGYSLIIYSMIVYSPLCTTVSVAVVLHSLHILGLMIRGEKRRGTWADIDWGMANERTERNKGYISDAELLRTFDWQINWLRNYKQDNRLLEERWKDNLYVREWRREWSYIFFFKWDGGSLKRGKRDKIWKKRYEWETECLRILRTKTHSSRPPQPRALSAVFTSFCLKAKPLPFQRHVPQLLKPHKQHIYKMCLLYNCSLINKTFKFMQLPISLKLQ